MSFIEALHKYRKMYDLPEGKAPRKGSKEYEDIMEFMGMATSKRKSQRKSEEEKAILKSAKAEGVASFSAGKKASAAASKAAKQKAAAEVRKVASHILKTGATGDKEKKVLSALDIKL